MSALILTLAFVAFLVGYFWACLAFARWLGSRIEPGEDGSDDFAEGLEADVYGEGR